MKQFAIIAMVCLMVSSCGIKPSTVEPPAGAGNTDFPRTYPDPSTDPTAKSYPPRGYKNQE